MDSLGLQFHERSEGHLLTRGRARFSGRVYVKQIRLMSNVHLTQKPARLAKEKVRRGTLGYLNVSRQCLDAISSKIFGTYPRPLPFVGSERRVCRWTYRREKGYPKCASGDRAYYTGGYAPFKGRSRRAMPLKPRICSPRIS